MHEHRLRGIGLVLSFALAAFAGLLAAVPAGEATHETTPWSTHFAAFSGPNYQYFTAGTADGKGFVYVFYYDFNSATGASNLYVAKVATSDPFGLPVVQFTRHVNPTLPNIVRRTTWWGDPAFISADFDGDGNLYVAWSHTGFDIYVSKSVDGGNTWGAPVQVSPAPANSWNFAPVLTVTPDNKIWVAWHQIWFPGGFQNVTIARSDDRAVTFTGTRNVTAAGQGQVRWLDLASDSQGWLYVAYQRLLGSGSHVNFTWSADGAAWSSPAQLNGGTNAWVPAIQVDAKDRIHVGWLDLRLAPSGEVTYWYRRTDDRGFTWTLELPVSQGTTNVGAGYPDLAVHEDTVLLNWDGDPLGPPRGIAYAVSTDGGDTWSAEAFADTGVGGEYPRITVDENGTFYATYQFWNEVLGNYDAGFVFWDAPPSAPSITGIARGTSSLGVSWSASPERDVMMYRVWRSQDGSTYTHVATVNATTGSYTDGGLPNGVYWYKVTSVDRRGTSSHGSVPAFSTVGLTTEEMIDVVEAEIARLQGDLAAAQGDIDAIQTELRRLQDELRAIRSEQATASMQNLNLILLIVVIVLLAVMFVFSRRRPGMGQPMPTGPPAPAPPTERMRSPEPAPPSEPPNLDEL